MQTNEKLISEYLAKGVKITTFPYKQPKKEELTFPVKRGSIAHSGRQTFNLRNQGIRGKAKR